MPEQLMPKMETKDQRKEQKELPVFNIALIDSTVMGNALKSVLKLINQKVELMASAEDLIEKMDQGQIDIIIYNLPGHISSDEKELTMRTITKIRNNPKISQQPLIIVSNPDLRKEDTDLQNILKAGADIGIKDINSFVVQLWGSIFSTPEMLARIEDDYSNKAVINKEQFYKRHQEKLQARSEITADTEQEVNFLDKVFYENKVEKVLDAAGGDGRIAIPLAKKGYEVTNLDVSADLIKSMSKKTKEVNGVVGDIRNLPFKDGEFEGIMYNWHVFCDILGNKGKQKVFQEAHRVLKKDGVISFDIPNLCVYEEVAELLGKQNPLLFEDPAKTKEKMHKLEKDIKSEEFRDPIAQSILLQGRNALAYILDEEIMLEPDIYKIAKNYADYKKHPENYEYNFEIEKVEFRKDGVYLSYPDNESVFIGYVPTQQEMEAHLEKAGFKNIQITSWKTRSGFYKLSFVAHRG